MDLKGAVIRNFFELTGDINNKEAVAKPVKIPHYQRPFSWEEEQIETLISDWSQHSNNLKENNDYFAGSIVTVTQEGHREHALIDGQQRFTTVYLVNFIRFSLLRLITRQAISSSMATRIEGYIKELNNSAEYVYESSAASLISDESKTSILESFDLDDPGSILDAYCDWVGLPSFPEDDDSFDSQFVELSGKLFDNCELHLQYDRKSYGVILKNALPKIVFTLSDQHTIDMKLPGNFDELPDVEKRYIQAIKVIFDTFKGIAEKNNDNDRSSSLHHRTVTGAMKMANTIQHFLDGVKFCIVQTGNTQDAYTLFEVLNDRSLSLSDLDLIKNQFYKTYCEQNTQKSSDAIDEIIEKRETQWGDQIFYGQTDGRKNLITFFTASFLTGDSTINFRGKHDSKEKITNYLKGTDSYSEQDIEIDFNIFQSCRHLIDVFGYVERRKDKKALSAEYSDGTVTYKTFHFLNSLGQEGVLAGLVNLILCKILHEKAENSAFEVKKFLEELKTNSGENKKIHEQSHEIWQLAILGNNYESPKERSNLLIKGNCRNDEPEVPSYPPLNGPSVQNIDEFKTWLKNWNYGQDDIKIRILFARLFQLQLQDTPPSTLVHKKFRLTIDNQGIQNLHLDHMEPSIVDDRHNPTSYFQDEDRELIVNGLGNMFPLPGDINISKSNTPFKNVWQCLKDAGLYEHWVAQKSKMIFDGNNVAGVPSKKFFSDRRDFLINMFCEAIRLSS